MPTHVPPKIITFDAATASLGRGVVRLPVSESEPTPDPDLERVFAAADCHGEASLDKDHAVGDLQNFIRACWARLTPEARREVLAEHEDCLDMWDPEQVR